MAEKYILKVTAGPTYDESTQHDVAVNAPEPVKIDTENLTAQLNVRIQNYRGLPKGSPSTSPYFSHETHKSDLYSISFTFTPKKTYTGDEIVFGNDFDHPIRDRLPWGFGTAFNFVKKWVDPGLYGDPYADEPHLYGPLLSSINVLRIGEKGSKDVDKMAEKSGDKVDGDVVVFEEGAEGDGATVREEQGIPEQSAARMKHFLGEDTRKDFKFEEGRSYACDFFNPYLDFNDFSLKLPVITLSIVKHWDGQPLRTHTLRYVLKDRTADKPLFVIILSLLPIDELGESEKADVNTTDTAADSNFNTNDDDLD
ncbi:DUF1769-domain-containing protein [Pseudovirgaria hyperparasitica]|uniref:DUF1769-domain-containing protein n=1 Tax=Pseudovirgaria hyperparasitica TaxID=470096 RepID=A0A6A6VZH6_9PEZI|nr:DUF1769-domain-containing protein [Pseudovirgaria hyperparasitica]KAF2755110.1 DUF1769-domain-containing protein [Pseudovirgaria hyperparasitica]